MKVKDITEAIDGARYVIAELNQEWEKDGNVHKISRIQKLINVIEEAEISFRYGEDKTK